MSRSQRLVRRTSMLFWRLFNPLARRMAGVLPFWVVLETTGHRSGVPRQVPLARGPVDGSTTWLICVHGEHASFARNILKEPRVRLKLDRRWREGKAEIISYDREIAARFSRYARAGPMTLGIEPKLVRIELDPG